MKYLFGVVLVLLVALGLVLIYQLATIFDVFTVPVVIVAAFFLGRYSKQGVINQDV